MAAGIPAPLTSESTRSNGTYGKRKFKTAVHHPPSSPGVAGGLGRDVPTHAGKQNPNAAATAPASSVAPPTPHSVLSSPGPKSSKSNNGTHNGGPAGAGGSGAAATAPLPKSGTGTGAGAGTGNLNGNNPAVASLKPRKHLNLQYIRSALSENTDGVENMKREGQSFQEEELRGAQRELIGLRKTHDRLSQSADEADVLHGRVCEELGQLERLAGVGKNTAAFGPQERLNKVNAKLQDTERKLKVSTEQKMVFGHMLERLKSELLVLQKEDNVAKYKDVRLNHELSSCNVQFESALQDLRVVEDKLEDLLDRLGNKRQQHTQRITGIKKTIEDRSVLLVKQEERNKRKDEIMTKADLGVDEEAKLKRMNVIRQLYTTILEKKMTDDEETLAQLENTFHRLKNVTGLSNVDEVVHKFLSRSEKNRQLQIVAKDLQSRIDALKAENNEAKTTLSEVIHRTEANAGNREVYKEVDLIDVAVTSAAKNCDDSKLRSTRLSVTIGELRETIGRFLSKVSNELVAPPLIAEMPDKIHELDNKITEMMKVVSANLAKKEEAAESVNSPTNENKESGVSGEGQSFNKIAGANIGKIMYHKMMTTDPDQTPRNVRVVTKMNAVQLGKFAQRTLLDPQFEKLNPPPSAQQERAKPKTQMLLDDEESEEEMMEEVVERETVKKLSKMILIDDSRSKRKEAAEKARAEKALEW